MFEDLLQALPYLVPLALLGGLAGGSTGFGTYLVIGPFLWMLFSPTESIAIALALGIPAWGLLFVLRKHVPWSDARRLLLFALPGLCLGIVLHLFLPLGVLQIGAAATILFLLFLSYVIGDKISIPLGGLVAGGLSTSVGFNGPPVSLALRGREEREMRGGTVATLLGLSLLVTIIFLFLDDQRGEFFHGYAAGLVLLPPVALGTWAGNLLAHRLGRRVEYVALVVSVVGAVLLLARSLV